MSNIDLGNIPVGTSPTGEEKKQIRKSFGFGPDDSPMRDIRDYGAVSGQDSTAAIQAALDVGKYSNGSDDFAGNSVFIPRGTWIISSPLKLYRGSVLSGVGDWDQGGSVLKMANGSNCSSIQTPFAHSAQSPTQYMRVFGIAINGNSANQTEERPAIDWRGAFVGSSLDYILVADWLGQTILGGGSSDTHISRIWSLATICSTYAFELNGASMTSGHSGFLLMTDIYCELVTKPGGARGNAFLFNRLVCANVRGLHTEYNACPITLRNCQVFSLEGFSSYGEGLDGNPEGSLIYVDGTGFFQIQIGVSSFADKVAATLPFKPSAAVQASTWVVPTTTGGAASGSWGGCSISNNSVSQGLGRISYGDISGGIQSVAGYNPYIHPRRELRKHAYEDGDLFWEEYRVDYGTLTLNAKINGNTTLFTTAVNQSPSAEYNYYQVSTPLLIGYDSTSLPVPAYANALYKKGGNLRWNSSAGDRSVSVCSATSSVPVDGTTVGCLGEELIVSETDVYKCVRVSPSRWKKLSP